MKILIEVSGRHIHLSEKDFYMLFGADAQLTYRNKLSQPNEFACEQQVILQKDYHTLKARIIAPFRAYTQIELCASDADFLGISAPRNLSGNFKNSAGIIVRGPVGMKTFTQGVILAKSHIHCDKKTADTKHWTNRQSVRVKYNNYIFEDVIIRINETFKLAMHIDVDEARQAGIGKGDVAMGNVID